jgi:hypothetical protein
VPVFKIIVFLKDKTLTIKDLKEERLFKNVTNGLVNAGYGG